MYEVKYNSQAAGVLYAVGLGSSSSSVTWCYVDDQGFFYDTVSYKKATPFVSTDKIQQIVLLSEPASNAINVPQMLTMKISGVNDGQSIPLTTNSGINEFWTFNTSNFSTLYPDNNNITILTTDHASSPTVDTLRATHTNFTIKQADFPSDVTCNYNQTGSYHIAKNLIISVTGNIKTGDTLTVTRSNHNPTTATFNVLHDTTGMASYFGVQSGEEVSLTYKHKDVTPTTRTVTYTSSDANISWLQATKETNTIHFAQGYCVDSSPADFNVDITYQDGTIKRFPYELPANSNGITYADKKLTLPDLTNATNVNIPVQSKLIQGELTLNLENCDITVPQPVTDSSGKVHYYVDANHRDITIKAHPGYVFTTDGNIKYNKNGSAYTSTITIPASNSDSITTTIPNDFNPLYPVTVTFGATQPDVVHDTGGFVNFYKADYPSLVSFSNEWINTVSRTGTVDTYDVTNYVSNLIMVPLEIPATLINAKSSIVAGNQTYKTAMPTIDDNNHIYDLGSINTPEIYKNGFDYYQVKTRLVLPFTDTVDLDPKHVINKTITIKYDVNFQNGDTTVIIANDNGVFFTKPFNLANEIPFVTASTNKSQYAVINRLQERFNNGIHQAYMLIEQPTPVLNNDYYNTIERGQLKAYTGNVKAELLNNINVPSSDLTNLQNLLRNGVKIK